MSVHTIEQLSGILKSSPANLSGVDLSGADLSGADLSGADLGGANLREAVLPHFFVCPEVGEFTAFKKLAGDVIAEITIPAEARRTSSLVGRRCRAEYAVVKALSGTVTSAESKRGGGHLHGRGNCSPR